MAKLIRSFGLGRVQVSTADALQKAFKECRKGTRIRILNNIKGNFIISKNDVSISASYREIIVANDFLNGDTPSHTFVVQAKGVKIKNITIYGSVAVKGNDTKLDNVTFSNTDCALYVHSDNNEFTNVIFQNISDSCAHVYGQRSRVRGCISPVNWIGFRFYGEKNMLNGHSVPTEWMLHNDANHEQPIHCSFQSTENFLQNLKFQLDLAELESIEAAAKLYSEQPSTYPVLMNLVEVMRNMVILEVNMTTEILGAPTRQVEEDGNFVHHNTPVQETDRSSYFERAVAVRPTLIAIREMQDIVSPSAVEPNKIIKDEPEEISLDVQDRTIGNKEATKLADILCDDPMLCNNIYQLINHLPIPDCDKIELRRRMTDGRTTYWALIYECLVAAEKRIGKKFSFVYLVALLRQMQLISSAENVITLLGQPKHKTGDWLSNIVMSSSPEKPSHIAIDINTPLHGGNVSTPVLIPSLSQVFEKAGNVGNALLKFAKKLLKEVSAGAELFLETVKEWTPEKIYEAVTTIMEAWGWEMVDNFASQELDSALEAAVGRTGADVVKEVYEQHAAPIGGEVRMPMYNEVCFHHYL